MFLMDPKNNCDKNPPMLKFLEFRFLGQFSYLLCIYLNAVYINAFAA